MAYTLYDQRLITVLFKRGSGGNFVRSIIARLLSNEVTKISETGNYHSRSQRHVPFKYMEYTDDYVPSDSSEFSGVDTYLGVTVHKMDVNSHLGKFKNSVVLAITCTEDQDKLTKLLFTIKSTEFQLTKIHSCFVDMLGDNPNIPSMCKFLAMKGNAMWSARLLYPIWYEGDTSFKNTTAYQISNLEASVRDLVV